MSKGWLAFAGSLVFSLLFAAGPARAQESAAPTQTQPADWTVVEYPEGQEVIADLTPTALLPDARGIVRVTRNGEQASIALDVSGLDAGAGGYHLYAVTHEGRLVPLGVVPTSGGLGTFNVTANLSRFMLVLSPNAGLTAVGGATPVALRSAVPEGLAVVPKSGGASSEESAATNTNAVAEEVGSDSTTAAAAAEESDYDVPLLGVGGFRRNAETQLRPRLSGELSGTRTAVFVKPLRSGETQVRVSFMNLREPEGGARYVLWAVSPDRTFTRLGHVDKPDRKQAAKIEARTALKDFGLFITTEGDAPAQAPSGPTVALVVR